MTVSAAACAQEERAAWYRLTLTPGLGPVAARALLQEFGLPIALFDGSVTQANLARVVGGDLARKLIAPLDAEQEEMMRRACAWLGAQDDRFLLTLADADYPRPLLELVDAPAVLFGAGRRELLARTCIAIVGSRSATRQGEQNASAFAATLGGAGLCVVSGLAAGIDAAAHRGALETPAGTIAFVGTGIDITYPASQARLAAAVARQGLVLSEFAFGTPPHPGNFPRRNRLIAAMARGVLVVEAAVRSGSLITARLATELGREVFAIPGSIHSPLARGCHRLLRDGAKLVESAQDVLEELRWGSTSAQAVAREEGEVDDCNDVLAALGHDPIDLDTLAQRLNRDAGTVVAQLLELELAARVERLPGNRYQRLQVKRR